MTRAAELSALLPDCGVVEQLWDGRLYVSVGRTFENGEFWRHAWKAKETADEDAAYWRWWSDLKARAIAQGVRWLDEQPAGTGPHMAEGLAQDGR